MDMDMDMDMATEIHLLTQRLSNMMIESDSYHAHDQRKVELVYNIFRTIETHPIILSYPVFRACVVRKITDIQSYHQSYSNDYESSLIDSMDRLVQCMTNITNIVALFDRLKRRVQRHEGEEENLMIQNYPTNG